MSHPMWQWYFLFSMDWTSHGTGLRCLMRSRVTIVKPYVPFTFEQMITIMPACLIQTHASLVKLCEEVAAAAHPFQYVDRNEQLYTVLKMFYRIFNCEHSVKVRRNARCHVRCSTPITVALSRCRDAKDACMRKLPSEVQSAYLLSIKENFRAWLGI